MSTYHRRSYFAANEDKFPFKARGSFKVSLGLEYPFMAIVSILSLAGIIATITLIPKIIFAMDENGEPVMGSADPSDPSWMLFIALTELFVLAIIVFVYLFLIKIILNGKTANYAADGNRFSVVVDKEQDVFFYSDVTAVTYNPIRFIDRIRGYEVQIRTAKSRRPYVYRVLLNKMVFTPNPDVTPFIILEERAGLRNSGDTTVFKRDEELMKSAYVGGEKAPDLPLPSQTEHSATDGMTDEEYLQYLRTNSELSHIRTNRSPAADAPQPVDTDEMTDEEYLEYLKAKRAAENKKMFPENSRPTHSMSDNGMPSISVADMAKATETTDAEDSSKTSASPLSPEAETNSRYAMRRVGKQYDFERKGEGSFKIPFRFERIIKIVIIVVAVLGIIDCGLDNLTAVLSQSHFNIFNSLQHMGYFLLFTAIWVGVAILFFWATDIGTVVNYRADNEKFMVYDNYGHTRTIRYDEVVKVHYYPLKRGIAQKGWNVNIVTSAETIIYSYYFPSGKEYVSPEDTPFYIIEQNIPKK